MTNGNDGAFSKATVYGPDEDRPGNVATYEDGEAGLTKREYFAAMVLSAYDAPHAESFERIAKHAVEMADALIDALNAEKEGV